MKELPDDHFLDVDDELLEFLESQGEGCIKEVHQSNTTNKENGYKLLSILIVGIGSSFVLLVQGEHPIYLKIGLGVFILYWSMCAIYLVTRVLEIQTRGLMSSSPVMAYTEPYKNINEEHFENFAIRGFSGKKNKLGIMRRYRLMHLSKIIEEMIVNNKNIRTRLNRVRIAVILTPVCSMLLAVVSFFSF